MKLVRLVVLALAFCSSLAVAAPATDASIKQLLEVTQARSTVDSMLKQVDAMIAGTVQRALSGKTPTPKQQAAIDRMNRRMAATVREEVSWDKLEPMYLRLYRETFSEEEVGSMLSFYRTPAGQAVIKKMPLMMQKIMLETQNTMLRSMPKFQKIQQDFIDELRAAEN